MIFAIEKIRDCWDEVSALGQQHWLETQQYRHSQPFKPMLERYAQYEDFGGYLQFTARVDGVLVGYGGLYIVPSMHTQELICQEDTWYLMPEHRKGFSAIKFFRFMEDECRKRGVKEVMLTAPATTRAGVIHKFLKYEKVADVYSKHL